MQKSVTTKALAEDAKQANSNHFLRLIKHVNTILAKEQKRRGINEEGGLLKIAPEGEAVIIGDIHGDLDSLLQIIARSYFLKKARKGKRIKLIFLGDYGDRGAYSPEVYYVILKLKAKYPSKVVLMRGNHEGPGDLMPNPHDLPAQLIEKYGSKATAAIYLELRNLFGKLYNVVLVDKQYVLIHGGFPSQAKSIVDFELANQKHPAESHLEEMLWNDPEEGMAGNQDSPRGAGRLFGADVSERMLKLLEVKVLIRGHQPADEGFKIGHNGKVLTVFSTNKPPYRNEFAGYLMVDLAEKVDSAEQLVDKIMFLK